MMFQVLLSRFKGIFASFRKMLNGFGLLLSGDDDVKNPDGTEDTIIRYVE